MPCRVSWCVTKDLDGFGVMCDLKGMLRRSFLSLTASVAALASGLLVSSPAEGASERAAVSLDLVETIISEARKRPEVRDLFTTRPPLLLAPNELEEFREALRGSGGATLTPGPASTAATPEMALLLSRYTGPCIDLDGRLRWVTMSVVHGFWGGGAIVCAAESKAYRGFDMIFGVPNEIPPSHSFQSGLARFVDRGWAGRKGDEVFTVSHRPGGGWIAVLGRTSFWSDRSQKPVAWDATGGHWQI